MPKQYHTPNSSVSIVLTAATNMLISLTDLPYEVRILIFEYLLGDLPSEIELVTPRSPVFTITERLTRLSQTCKDVRHHLIHWYPARKVKHKIMHSHAFGPLHLDDKVFKFTIDNKAHSNNNCPVAPPRPTSRFFLPGSGSPSCPVQSCLTIVEEYCREDQGQD